MSFWRLLLSGLRRNPKEHMPWLQDVANQQQQVKKTTRQTHQYVQDLERRLRLEERQDIQRRRHNV